MTRRAVSTIDHAKLSDSGTVQLATIVEELADASAQLGQAASETGPGFDRWMSTARNSLAAVATQLHPRRLNIDDLEGEALVLLIRTMVVDLLEAAGYEHDDAQTYLPAL